MICDPSLTDSIKATTTIALILSFMVLYLYDSAWMVMSIQGAFAEC